MACEVAASQSECQTGRDCDLLNHSEICTRMKSAVCTFHGATIINYLLLESSTIVGFLKRILADEVQRSGESLEYQRNL